MTCSADEAAKMFRNMTAFTGLNSKRPRYSDFLCWYVPDIRLEVYHWGLRPPHMPPAIQMGVQPLHLSTNCKKHIQCAFKWHNILVFIGCILCYVSKLHILCFKEVKFLLCWQITATKNWWRRRRIAMVQWPPMTNERFPDQTSFLSKFESSIYDETTAWVIKCVNLTCTDRCPTISSRCTQSHVDTALSACRHIQTSESHTQMLGFGHWCAKPSFIISIKTTVLLCFFFLPLTYCYTPLH